MDNLERDKIIQKAVLDTVGLGIAVYDSKGALFCNETIFRLPDFLKGGLPKTLNAFLETFDNGNQLKSNYILSLENGVNLIRVNYINKCSGIHICQRRNILLSQPVGELSAAAEI